MSLRGLIDACRTAGVLAAEPDATTLAPATCLRINAPQWAQAAALARAAGWRWCALWADEIDTELEACCCLERGGRYVVLRTRPGPGEDLPSHAPVYPAADRPERHARDLLGLRFADAPDGRRWTRHRAWGAHEFPLRQGFVPNPAPPPTPPDDQYPFLAAQGAGVVEIPVGPVHAGIIEPGHFRFQAVGEMVLNLEQHLGYAHKGIERLAQGRDPAGLARLAARVSGDSTVAHAWAACQALERALALTVPPRALWLRALMAERERIANHMGDIGAICNDVGFVFAQAQLTRLKELWVRENHAAFGHRFMMDRVVPGGVCAEPDPRALAGMAAHAGRLGAEFAALIERIEASESVEDRLMTTGRLAPDQASLLGAVGYVGRASGQTFDLRRDAPYPPYDRLDVPVPGYRAGDVAARAKVRAEETLVSLQLVRKLVEGLPDGPIAVELPRGGRAGEGLGLVEGWRGEIITYVRLDARGRVQRFFPRDPSWLNWPALELLIQGNIVPDFPVCNKSVNGSYSGQDL
ncbi:MAG: NADH-quinone oxidoreductase subunit C [Gammaproteobacteria bacterium]|nr:NADH-quinone oxidoreductase subunit C [Gammaproteobacteria bacterium]